MSVLEVLREAAGSSNTGDAHVDPPIRQVAPDMHPDQAPSFGHTVATLFGQSSPVQQAGVLNQILATLGPAAASALAGGVLGRLLQPGQMQLTPEQASQLSSAQVSQIAAHAQEQHAGVVEEVGRFYAQHAGLIQTLGGAALAVVLAKVKENVGR